mmetsp:Transcript_21164/g.48047  ORF Transcript_21164/g.48047 Transcript_21164/m.48047 type:complete len:112 (+) Transcript_21164:254-589(+)
MNQRRAPSSSFAGPTSDNSSPAHPYGYAFNYNNERQPFPVTMNVSIPFRNSLRSQYCNNFNFLYPPPANTNYVTGFHQQPPFTNNSPGHNNANTVFFLIIYPRILLSSTSE